MWGRMDGRMIHDGGAHGRGAFGCAVGAAETREDGRGGTPSREYIYIQFLCARPGYTQYTVAPGRAASFERRPRRPSAPPDPPPAPRPPGARRRRSPHSALAPPGRARVSLSNSLSSAFSYHPVSLSSYSYRG